MGVKKCAYCLVPHDFDDTPKSRKLILDYRGNETEGLSYTPFLKNSSLTPFFYYISIKDLMMCTKPFRLPEKCRVPTPDGRGGIIIDSGYGFGFMVRPVFELITKEFKRRMAKYRRSNEAENDYGVSPCYNLTGEKSIKIPDKAFQFTNGANIVVPPKNYVLSFPEGGISCFAFDTDHSPNSSEVPLVPSIILSITIIVWSLIRKMSDLDLENKVAVVETLPTINKELLFNIYLDQHL